MNNKMREQFEQWDKECGAPEFSFRKTEDGDYANPYTASRWEAWQAALSTVSTEQKPLCGALTDEQIS